MTKAEQERLETQLQEMWELVNELETVSLRLRVAADRAIQSLNDKRETNDV